MTTGIYCHGCYFCGCGGDKGISGVALVVGGGSVCGDSGVLALVMDFREVLLTSPPQSAHCAPQGPVYPVYSHPYAGAWEAGGSPAPRPGLASPSLPMMSVNVR